MTKTKSGPSLSTAGVTARATRQERLAAALRENLRKRKTQARERAAPDEAARRKSNQS